MKKPTIMQTAAVGTTCALLGTAAGIAGSSASTNNANNGRAGHAAKTGAVRFGMAIGPGFAIGGAFQAMPPAHRCTPKRSSRTKKAALTR